MDPLDIKPIRQEMEEYIVLEEDPEIYAMAGIELVPVPALSGIPRGDAQPPPPPGPCAPPPPSLKGW
jgi:hypothetical protein